jgi:hypothetical protein
MRLSTSQLCEISPFFKRDNSVDVLQAAEGGAYIAA